MGGREGRSAAETRAEEELHGGGVRGRGRRGGGQRREKPEGRRDAGFAARVAREGGFVGSGEVSVPPVFGGSRFPGTDRALRALSLPTPKGSGCHDSVVLGDTLRVRPSKGPLTRWRLEAAGPSGSSEPSVTFSPFLG